MSFIIWEGSTTLLTLGDQKLLTDAISSELVTDATVRANIYNETQSVTIGPITLTHVTATPGRYRGVVAYNQASLAVGDRLRVEIFANAGTNKQLTIAMKATVKMRTA